MMQGILIVDKPMDWTSFDVVAKLRGVLGTRKLGHSGTLDPMATGVLPVFCGGASKAVDLQLNHDKTYRATLQITATELQTATPLLTLPGQEMAELTVNGQPAGVSFWPPHKFPLAGLLTPGENALTLTLTGSPANRYGKHPVPYGLER